MLTGGGGDSEGSEVTEEIPSGEGVEVKVGNYRGGWCQIYRDCNRTSYLRPLRVPAQGQ